MRISGDGKPVCIDLAAAGRYVLGRRTPDGGYSFYRTPEWFVEEPNAPDTLAALESLRLLGTAAPDPHRTIGWLRRLQDPCGGYPALTIGWAALRSLSLLDTGPSRSPRSWVRHWLDILATGPAVRDCRAALTQRWHLLELVHLGYATNTSVLRDSVIALLDWARTPAGAWARPGPDLEASAIAVQLARSAGVPLRPEPLIGLLRSCEDERLGLRMTPRARATSAGALWGGLVLGKEFDVGLRYPDAVAASLGLLQRPDGGLGRRHRAISTLRDTWQGVDAAFLLGNRQARGS